MQETSLQAYLDLMADLLLQHELRESPQGTEVRAIAQAQTLTTLRKQDAEGKRTVVLFLGDAGLIQSTNPEREPPISLAEADLERADLREANLSGADLSGADLSEANLERADLRSADLKSADLRSVNLRSADLRSAKASKEQLNQANSLEGATMPDGSKHP